MLSAQLCMQLQEGGVSGLPYLCTVLVLLGISLLVRQEIKQNE